MARLLVLAAAVILFAYLLSEGLARLRGRFGELLDVFVGAPLGRRGPAADRVGGGSRGGVELVACAVCGVHVPRLRAIEGAVGGGEAAASRFYCSEACEGAASRGAASRGPAARS